MMTLRGATFEVQGCLFAIGEDPGALVHEIGAPLFPRKSGGVFFSGELDLMRSDNERLTFNPNILVQRAVHGVVLEEVRDRFRAGEVVDADNFDIPSFQRQTCDFTANTSKTIDSDFDGLRHAPPILREGTCFNARWRPEYPGC